MEKKELKQIEVTLKNILYFVEDKKEQEKVIKILEECEARMSDSKLKNSIDKFFKKFKRDYFEVVDFLVKDILYGVISNEERKIVYDMLNQLKPTIEVGKKSFLDKLIDLFSWS